MGLDWIGNWYREEVERQLGRSDRAAELLLAAEDEYFGVPAKATGRF